MKRIKYIISWSIIGLMVACNSPVLIEQTDTKVSQVEIFAQIYLDDELIDTRASSEAGYVTGGGLYHLDDLCTVAAYTNQGYELVSFFCQQDSYYEGDSVYSFRVEKELNFVAKFKKTESYSGTYYFISNNPAFGSVDKESQYIKDYRDARNDPLIATPVSAVGGEFVDWEYQNKGSNAWSKVYNTLVRENNVLMVDYDYYFEERFFDGTTFRANFKKADPVINSITIVDVCENRGNVQITIEADAQIRSELTISLKVQGRWWYRDYYGWEEIRGTSTYRNSGNTLQSHTLKPGEHRWGINVSTSQNGGSDGGIIDIDYDVQFINHKDDETYLYRLRNEYGYVLIVPNW